MTSVITPPVILERSALFAPQGSKFKPNEPPGYYARLLVSEAALQTAAWRELNAAVDDIGHTQFGSGYEAMKRNGTFRSPFRREVAGKGWPSEIALFINAKSGGDFKPSVVGRDALPIMDQSAIYPGCIVRVSLRAYAYGGSGSPYSPGISLGLNSIQKLGDGPRLSSARGDGSEFGAVSDDLDDLLK